MLLQQGPGPSGSSSPKLLPPSPKPSATPKTSPKPLATPKACPKPTISPKPGSPKTTSSPIPRFGSPGDGTPNVGSPRLGASPRLGSDSPRGLSAKALCEEAKLERLQTELKEGWTVHIGRDGRLYYCNHVTRTASWLPPAESWQGGCDENGDELPYGWEQAADCRGKPYYINHVNKTTTYVAPEGRSWEPPPEPRDVVLDRHPELGFGFVAGSERPVLVRFVTDNSPSVGKLEPGDEILCVNGEDVRNAAREHVIAAVRACSQKVTLRVCQPARTELPSRRSALLSAAKRARLKAKPPRVRFADSVQLNGAPLYPPSAFSLGDLCLPPMANVLKVFLENGQTKSFKYDTTTTVQDVFISLKDKLCITAEEHFSLVVEHVKSLRRNKLTLLDLKEPLARIAARPGAHKMRCLFRVAFVPTSAAELAQRDLAALEYLFLQCCNDVTAERFAPELRPEVALKLAAVHMYQHALANNVSPAKLTVKSVEREFGLERFLPPSLLDTMKRKELRRMISHCLKLHAQVQGNSQKQLTQLQAKLHYLDMISSLPSYGAKCFSSNNPERVLLISPRFGLSQIVGVRNSVPQQIANVDEVTGVKVTKEDEVSVNMTIFLQRDRVLNFSMDDRDGAEMALVLAGYYKVITGQELNVDQEREPMTEDIAPPYLSQHNVIPAKWSYLEYDDTVFCTRKHYAIFSMPPPYHSTPSQTRVMETRGLLDSKNDSATSSPLMGYDGSPGLLGRDYHFDKCKRNEDFRLFDSGDVIYYDDGMGFDIQSVLSMELLENASDHPKLAEAKNDEVLRRVAEMQKLVENSEQYLNEHGEVVFAEMPYNQRFLESDFSSGKETSVDQAESDNESNNSRMSMSDDAPGILKHSDSLILLTETIKHGLNGLDDSAVPHNDSSTKDLSTRQSQGLSAILNNSGITDALIALNNDFSESDNDSQYTPTNSPIRKHQKKINNKIIRTSFGLHSPDTNTPKTAREQNLKEYLRQLREKSEKKEDLHKDIPYIEVCPYNYQEEHSETDLEIIDLRLIPPPQTPDELDTTAQVPQILPMVPSSFADDHKSTDQLETSVDDIDEVDSCAVPSKSIDDFLANVSVPPPIVKVSPVVALTPEEIQSYIIPPPPCSNNTSLERPQATYVNQNEINTQFKSCNQKHVIKTPVPNGEVVKGTLSVSEIRNMFNAKTLSEARNSLLLDKQGKPIEKPKMESSPPRVRSSPPGKMMNGAASHVIEYPTVERKGMFSCCSKDKDKNKAEENCEDSNKTETNIDENNIIPDVCEIRPPPRRKCQDIKPPERPPKNTPQFVPVPRPRSNSFTYPNNELAPVNISENQFSTLNNRRLNYRIVCDMNQQGNFDSRAQESTAPKIPPRIERKALSPPPPILLPPKKPPLPPVPSAEVLRIRTTNKFGSPTRNPEQRLASIGSPHFQRNLNAYRSLENEHRLLGDEANAEQIQRNGHLRNSSNPQDVAQNSLTLQCRHARSNSETSGRILKSNEMSNVLSLCSPQMNRKFSNRPDLLNGAPAHDPKTFSPTLSDRKFRSESPSSKPHVRFKEDLNCPKVNLDPGSGGNGHVVTVENLLCKTEVAVEGLLQRLHQVAQKCAHQHAHGGGEDIDEAKFQAARSDLTAAAVVLVGASRTLVGALGAGPETGSSATATALADCLNPLRKLADLAQALGRHTSSPLQTRNLVLRVHDVTAAFKDLAGAEMARIYHDHVTKTSESASTLDGQLALRAECLANVLATLLRSLRVFSP